VEEDVTEPSANEREERNAAASSTTVIVDVVMVVEILRLLLIPQHLPSKRRENERCQRIRKEDYGMLRIRGRRSHELSRMQKLPPRRLMMPLLTINQMSWKPHRCSLQSDNHRSQLIHMIASRDTIDKLRTKREAADEKVAALQVELKRTSMKFIEI
jgi:hypothetical protein